MRKYTSLPFVEYPVAEGNYDTNREPINKIVLHTTVGTIEGTASRFNNPASQVSAHYAIGLDGTIYAFLEEYNVAYANGNYQINQEAISIEHVDNGDYNGQRPDSLYLSSGKLVRDICQYYNIPIDREHILDHRDVPGASTACPDSLDTNRIIAYAQNPPSTPQAVISNQAEELLAVRAERDSLLEQVKQLSLDLAKKEELRDKWYGLYQQANSNYETCKTDRTTFQKQLTELQNTSKPKNTHLLKIYELLISLDSYFNGKR